MELRNRILAHRGFWTDQSGSKVLEQNSKDAISRAFELGFGVEIDIRDFDGELVLAHDLATKQSQRISEIELDSCHSTIALNVKSDGLIPLIRSFELGKIQKINHFFFDMSFPEQRKYFEAGLSVAIRTSEFENVEVSDPHYIWLDSFIDDWYVEDFRFFTNFQNSIICIVSPELHNRPFGPIWEQLIPYFIELPNILICTDFPMEFAKALER
jgi:glycerophosphoryl diester phosphodiesterase